MIHYCSNVYKYLNNNFCAIFRGNLNWARLGASNFQTADPTHVQQFKIVTRIPHPDFKPPIVYNDIAVIALERNVTLNKYVRPICFQVLNDITLTKPVATGWGRNKIDEDLSDELKIVKLNFVSRDECQKNYEDDKNRIPNGINDTTQFCAATAGEGEDTCQVISL